MNPPVSSPAVKVIKSVREQVSAEEWQARVDLAACYRLTAMYGMTEMVANHISCRVPGTTDQFLLNPYGMLYEEIDASGDPASNSAIRRINVDSRSGSSPCTLTTMSSGASCSRLALSTVPGPRSA